MIIDKIKQVIKLFESSSLSEMDVEFEDIKLALKKATSPSTFAPVVITEQKDTVAINNENVEVESGHWIVSPIVGTFYRASSPTAKPFVEIGQKVNVNDVICIIEAMKVMNEIKSTVSGIVREIVVESNELVEFDQQLIRIECND